MARAVLNPSVPGSTLYTFTRQRVAIVHDIETPRILLVEDSVSLAGVYKEYLKREPWLISHVETGKAALAELAGDPPDAVLLDVKLPDMNGLDILAHINEQQMPTSVVIITAHGSVDMAVEALRDGAIDFIEKPFTADRLLVTLRNTLERRQLADLVHSYEDLGRPGYCGFVGSSLKMQAVYRMIETAAPSNASVFITGESGTGKEVCAEAIHARSTRADGPFVPLNCAAVPRDLIESEVFGHTKGAFTGAVANREGAASQANGGTLFLDEITEMSPDLQAKLLRFVQTGTFQKVGSDKVEKVDIRFVCATNREPLQAVQEGHFREDLYYRLHVIPIHLPPLCERGNDVLEIARRFLTEFAEEENRIFNGFAQETESIFLAYGWPGNVRELQNTMRNIVVMGSGGAVTLEMLPASFDTIQPGVLPTPVATVPYIEAEGSPGAEIIRPLWQVEKAAIESAIDACGGNVPRAAALLELSPSTLYRKRLGWKRAAES